MKLVLKVRSLYRRCEPWFKASEKTLAIIQSSRGNGIVSKALGAFSITGAILKAALPEDSVEEFLRQQRFRSNGYQSIGGFICELLIERLQPTAILAIGLTSQLYLWETEEGNVAAIFHNGEYGDGPLTRDGNDEPLAEIIRRLAWSQHEDLVLSAQPSSWSWRGCKKYRLIQMPDPEQYIGLPRPDDLARRLDRYGDTPRTVLLRGTTGVGKSILARQTARLVCRGSNRTLKVTGGVLRSCPFDELLSLVRLLQPSVLLLDDLPLSERNRVDEFLLILESLRVPGSLVFVTMMTDDEPNRRPAMGDAYFPGMRPGRIDEVCLLPLPDERNRSLILQHYYDKFGVEDMPTKTHRQIVQATEGLSGAYLAEIARRIATHGIKSWRKEVAQVIVAAPNHDKNKNTDASTKPPSNDGRTQEASR